MPARSQAGLVVVVSAGNYGQTATGAPVLGGITSPGNSPFAITVGALDMAGTVDRRDDRVAAYSSRGPTRYDFAVKPDVVAPGASLVSLENRGSWLSTRYPNWHVAGSGKNAYYRLSGTSMSAAVVSGGVALLLDATPRLNPAQVKIALQTGAQFLPEAGLDRRRRRQRRLRRVAAARAGRARRLDADDGDERARVVAAARAIATTAR